MNIAWILLYTLVTHGLEIVIFFKVDGIGITFERIFKAFLFKILLAFVFLMIEYMVGYNYLFYGTLVRYRFVFLTVKRAS